MMFTLFGIDDLFGFSLIFFTMLDFILHVWILFMFFMGILLGSVDFSTE
jgi:hypothetical protein